ncbi:MAG: sucrose-6-phosphate hydrolase [Candidatus Nanopelagicales bacterium]
MTDSSVKKMGKPYKSELAQLISTWEWAAAADVAPLAKALRSTAFCPLVAVGSGGSLTAAHLLALLHRHFAKRVSSVSTPYDVKTTPPDTEASIWLISAGGSNRDILDSFRSIVHLEPRQVGVICGRPDSRLAEDAAAHRYVDFFGFSLPSGKDGFLATNSLLVFSVLIARAYARNFSTLWDPRPPSGDAFAGGTRRVGHLEALRRRAGALWQRPTLLVLHGNATRIGAVDLESKFTEGALGNLQVADYRNFAHGRHHWLAKRGESSGILAFTTPEDRRLAAKTLALVPREIPVVRVDFPGDLIRSALASLFFSLHFAGWAGVARGIDPGRPGVPKFGERLYHLAVPKFAPRPDRVKLAPRDRAAIERKSGASVEELAARGTLPRWQKDLRSFRRLLNKDVFSAVVFDYDGTLVDSRHRLKPPFPEIATELTRLLEAGLLIGIATGRGKSVRKDLRACIPPQHWKRVLVGYYNCADIAPLEDETRPDGSHATCPELVPVADALRRNQQLADIAKQEDRPKQITLEPKVPVPEDRLWQIAVETIRTIGAKEVSVVRSSHSVDVLAPGVSKVTLITRLKSFEEEKAEGDILRIGDRGRWPGNDFELLLDRFALSVDEVSADPGSCWNLAPRGYRGVQATLHYLHALRVDGTGGLIQL